LSSIDNRLLPQVGQFKSLKYNTSYYVKLLPVNPYEYSRNIVYDCENLARLALKTTIEQRDNYLKDSVMVNDYIKDRLKYFEGFLTNLLEHGGLLDPEVKEEVKLELKLEPKLETKIEKGKGMEKVTKAQIEELLGEGLNITEISEKLNVHKSTVSRKLK
jgi:hypothetical protein